MLHEQPADVFVHRTRAGGLDEFDAAITNLERFREIRFPENIAEYSVMALTWRRAIFRPSNGTLKAKIVRYSRRASRKSPVGHPKNAHNGVTANFWPSFTTRPYGKSGENWAEPRGQRGKAQFS